jgi:hypothetical protein
MASICCSPPESCWPPLREPLGQARKRRHHAVEGPGAPAVDARALAHHEVFAHRQVRKDAAAFGHVADAQARHFLRRQPVTVRPST